MRQQSKTDWNNYYATQYKPVKFTRNITEKQLLVYFQKYNTVSSPHILEIGGANSCFYDGINKTIRPSQYTVLDNNKAGINLFMSKHGHEPHVNAVCADALNKETFGKVGNINTLYDIVYSVGLIEHFNEVDLPQILQAHFIAAKHGGIVLITFPTPTKQYWIVRYLMTVFGKWIFYDENPLRPSKVKALLEKHGNIESEKHKSLH